MVIDGRIMSDLPENPGVLIAFEVLDPSFFSHFLAFQDQTWEGPEVVV